MTTLRKSIVALLSVASLGALGVAHAPPAEAATATWFDGDSCHNVVRTETGGTLGLPRSGQEAEGVQGEYTIWYDGLESTTAATSYVAISTRGGALNYSPGSYSVHIFGGAYGECAQAGGVARATGVPTGGMRVGAEETHASEPRYQLSADTQASPLALDVPEGFTTDDVRVYESDLSADETLVSLEVGDVTVTTLQLAETMSSGDFELTLTDRSGQQYTVTSQDDATFMLTVP